MRSARGEIPDADPGRVLDVDEEGDLLGRDAERARFAAKLAADLEQGRPQGIRESEGVDPWSRAYR